MCSERFDSAVRWALSLLGAGWELAGMTAGAGRSHATRIVTVVRRGHERVVVLKLWADPNWQQSYPDFPPSREASALTTLAASSIPAPRLVGYDEEGTTAGLPALLMTHLPGEVWASRTSERDTVDQLADVAARLHATCPAQDLPSYRPWSPPGRCAVPTTSRRPHLWEQVHALAAGVAPDCEVRMIHRDFHLGNTLWAGDMISGVIDWTTCSLGPAAIDVSMIRQNLSYRVGPAAPDAFLRSYERRSPSYEHDLYWDFRCLADVHGAIPPPELALLEAHVERLLRQRS